MLRTPVPGRRGGCPAGSDPVSGGIGYVVVEYNQASGWPGLPLGATLHDDLADACFERDVLADQARERGRRERYAVCEVAEPQDEDQ